MGMTVIINKSTGEEIARREIAASEQAALAGDLPGEAGIADWLIKALEGKIDNCSSRMAGAALDLARAGVLAPSNLKDLSQASLVAALAAHPAYKDRQARDQQEQMLRATLSEAAKSDAAEAMPPAGVK